VGRHRWGRCAGGPLAALSYEPIYERIYELINGYAVVSYAA
jgi:hypothetical protein